MAPFRRRWASVSILEDHVLQALLRRMLDAILSHPGWVLAVSGGLAAAALWLGTGVEFRSARSDGVLIPHNVAVLFDGVEVFRSPGPATDHLARWETEWLPGPDFLAVIQMSGSRT